MLDQLRTATVHIQEVIETPWLNCSGLPVEESQILACSLVAACTTLAVAVCNQHSTDPRAPHANYQTVFPSPLKRSGHETRGGWERVIDCITCSIVRPRNPVNPLIQHFVKTAHWLYRGYESSPWYMLRCIHNR